jgi:hypothetical protein
MAIASPLFKEIFTPLTAGFLAPGGSTIKFSSRMTPVGGGNAMRCICAG